MASNWTIEQDVDLCDLLDRAQQIIRQQAELLSMHGVETDGKALERQRSELLAEIERSI